MSQTRHVDAIVAGAGLAGASAACVLSGLGYRVLVVDAGLDHGRRLSGELIHSLGVAHLRTLGLFRPLVRAGGVPVRGFAVFSCHGQPPRASPLTDSTGAFPTAELLDYPETSGSEHGLAVERVAMMAALLGALTELPNIELWKAARVTHVQLQREGLATVTVRRQDGECKVVTPLLVAAGGRSSFLRRSAGVSAAESRISVMLGYHLTPATLPHPGYGHVFVGGPGPVVAYPLGADRVRMLIDVPGTPVARLTTQTFAAYAHALPSGFREAAQDAIEKQTPLVAATYSMIPKTSVNGCVAFAGDAAGCCHPLTASGMSFSTRDALWLRQALCQAGGDFPAALKLYSSLRANAQQMRFLLADLLYNMFSARTPGMRLLCSGTLRYWQSNPRGRQVTMALLASDETRLHVLAREYLSSAYHALPALWTWPSNPRSLVERKRALMGLLSDSLSYMWRTAKPYARYVVPGHEKAGVPLE